MPRSVRLSNFDLCDSKGKECQIRSSYLYPGRHLQHHGEHLLLYRPGEPADPDPVLVHYRLLTLDQTELSLFRVTHLLGLSYWLLEH